MSTRADRAYLARFAIAMGSYTLLLPVMTAVLNHFPHSPWRFAAVLLVVPSLLGVVWAVGRFAREADELQSRQLVESLALGFAGGCVLTFTWGLLELAGAPRLPTVWAPAVFMGCWLVAKLVVRTRY